MECVRKHPTTGQRVGRCCIIATTGIYLKHELHHRRAKYVFSVSCSFSSAVSADRFHRPGGHHRVCDIPHRSQGFRVDHRVGGARPWFAAYPQVCLGRRSGCAQVFVPYAVGMSHFVYILRCADDSLYVGSTNDLTKRLHQHNHLKSGAHYTKIRRPVALAYSEPAATFHDARAREAELKRLSREKKLELIENLKNKII